MKRMEDALGDMARLRRTIEESPFDAVVAVSPENVRYAGDVHISTQKGIRDRLALIVWAKSHDPIFIVCQVEEAYVRQESWIQDIRRYKEFVLSPVSVLADVLEELGLGAGNVGIELAYLAATYYRALVDRLPKLRLAPCEAVFEGVRMIKTARERALMRNAFRSTEKAMLATYIGVRAGDSEKDLANRLANAIMLSGADEVAFNHINAGPNTGFPHMAASDYRVCDGDIVKADSGGYYREYMSNVGRTAKVGKPSPEDLSYWKRLREIHHEIIAMARPGNTGRQLFEAATRLYAKHGLPFPFAHNGHGIGLQVHEHTLISPHEEIAYEPGMVTTVETHVRWVGKVGYHMEDLIEITEGAPKLLSDYFDNEEILVV